MSELDSTLRCAGCGRELSEAEGLLFRCPAADAEPDVDHLVTPVLDLAGQSFPRAIADNPFVRYRGLLHSYRLARRRGLTDRDYVDLVERLDRAIAEVDGHGFAITPYRQFAALAGELGLGPDGWLGVKDETGNVSGSHKARHLMGIALALEVAERTGLVTERAPLAIASCGNAALAAAVVARAAGRELEVFIPPWADPAVVDRLVALGARLATCERRPADPPGDPCCHQFRAAVRAGALPFTCQGSDNGLTIEGGMTLGWELVAQHEKATAKPLDRIVIQVGGGALASSLCQALASARALGAGVGGPAIHAVQTEGGHPLERSWRRLVVAIGAALVEGGVAAPAPWPTALDDVVPPALAAQLAAWIRDHASAEQIAAAVEYAARHRSQYMWPWEQEPRSAAHGILDDETYDWLVVVRSMIESGGYPIVASEASIAAACDRGRALTGIDVDATGTSGLAGLLELRDAGVLAADDQIAVLFTGARR